MKIIGLSGTNGAGKDSVGDILAEHHQYLFVSVTDLLREEAKRRGLPIEREVLRTIGNEWRRQLGPGALVDQAVELFKKQAGKYQGLVIASLRNPGEADRVHELGGEMVWVDADPKVRYDRVFSRQRSKEDNKSFEEFLDEEQIEMQSSGDVSTLNMGVVKEKADIFLMNNGSDLEAFKQDAEAALGLAA